MWAALRGDRTGSYVMVHLGHCLGRLWAKSSDTVRSRYCRLVGGVPLVTDQILCVTFAVGGSLYILCEAKTAPRRQIVFWIFELSSSNRNSMTNMQLLESTWILRSLRRSMDVDIAQSVGSTDFRWAVYEHNLKLEALIQHEKNTLKWGGNRYWELFNQDVGLIASLPPAFVRDFSMYS